MSRSVFFLFLMASIFMIKCTVEGPVPTVKEFTNKLLINGVEDEIKIAEMEHFPKLPANKNYNIELRFYSGTTEASYKPTRSYSGVGSFFDFFLWSQDSTLASGTYKIDGFVNQDFSISKATGYLNVDWDTGESDFGSRLDGFIEVENLGTGKYKININCTDYEGSSVAAFYEGEFYQL